MFCYGAIVRYGCGRRSGESSTIHAKAVKLWLSSSSATCLGSTVNSANNSVIKRAVIVSGAPILRTRLHQAPSAHRITPKPIENHSSTSSQLFPVNAITKCCCNVASRLAKRELCRYCLTGCSQLPVAGDSCQEYSCDYDFVRPSIARWVGPVKEVGRVLTDGIFGRRQDIVTASRSIFFQQYCALSTTSSVGFRLFTVGSQSSKKGPVEGSKSGPPVLEDCTKDVTDKMSLQEQASEDLKKVSQDEWRRRLDKETFKVCRLKGTEMPGSGKYLHHTDKGTYVCACCHANLFRSEDKFNHCGWPSFRQAMGTKQDGSEESTNVKREYDGTHGMVRTEVLCNKCGSHLGHVFDDGPEPFGTRFCINSLSLDFVKDQ